MNDQPTGQRLAELLRTFWFPTVAAVALAATWGGSMVELTSVVQSNREILAKVDDLRVKVAAISTSNQYTAFQIADLRERLRLLETRR